MKKSKDKSSESAVAKALKVKNTKVVKPRFQQEYTQSQNVLREIFRGEQTFGTGQNLPVINNTLNSGGGIIKNGDRERRTARMFGLR